MHKKTIFRSLIAGAFICFSGWAIGQPGGFGRSPQINPDKTVTFRINAPNAQDVKLSVQSERGPVQMEKMSGAHGVQQLGLLNPIFILITILLMGFGLWMAVCTISQTNDSKAVCSMYPATLH